MIEKTYSPNDIEGKNYQKWEESGLFKCDVDSDREPFVIMMPPPNVTGSLHMGHALNYSLQDVMIRFQRMLGKDVLWQPGTDHAGIATQAVVEKQLAEEGLTRHDLGREKFLERVWQWKEQSGNKIVQQQRKLGTSPDWERERFTMDEGLNRAVRKVFVQLYKDGLMYRAERLVNWDTQLLTAVSDLEVENREVKGKFYHFKYPISDTNGEQFLEIATTRPETMFGDTAVAVNANDERYKHLIGKTIDLPLTDRKIPIIADDHADPEKGTGAVKITPAHDFDDFAVGKRHDLPMITIMDEHGVLNENAPEQFRGMDVATARAKTVDAMKELGLLIKIEDKDMMVPISERSGVVIEPRLTLQWFVDAETLSREAIKKVEDKSTIFLPKHWEATYFEWLRNIQPWCVSRQIWWGHQIPAWYSLEGDDKVFVEETEEEAYKAARDYYGRDDVKLKRDEDVLDTWFSSALWPFSTLGWPDETKELKKYYPGDILVTGFDIIFFWVARMMMMGLYFMKDVPFRKVFINALIRDEHGQKMSKSKGNVVDPLELMDQFGADALRFSLIISATPGVDVRFSEKHIESYRNFATKIWNAARFLESQECKADRSFDPDSVNLDLNKWLVSKVRTLGKNLTKDMNNNRFDLGAHGLYQFIWHDFCDSFIELSKPILFGDDKAAIVETKNTAMWVFEYTLKLLHPYMPFISEELFGNMFAADEKDLLMAKTWPVNDSDKLYDDAVEEIDWLIKVISDIRSAKASSGIAPSAGAVMVTESPSARQMELLSKYEAIIKRLARISGITHNQSSSKGQVHYGDDDSKVGDSLNAFAFSIFPEAMDAEAVKEEVKRLKKAIEACDREIKTLSGKLSNKAFVDKAPKAVVEKNQKWLEEEKTKREKLMLSLSQLEPSTKEAI